MKLLMFWRPFFHFELSRIYFYSISPLLDAGGFAKEGITNIRLTRYIVYNCSTVEFYLLYSVAARPV
jgi:hypothetical protein